MVTDPSIRDFLDKLYEFFASRYLNTSMLYVPHYYRRKICRSRDSCSKDLEVLAFVSAMYDFGMRVPIIKNNFLALLNYMIENNLKLQDLASPNIAGEALRHVREVMGRKFHRFDPCGDYLPVLIRIGYEADLEREALREREHDRAVLKAVLRKAREILKNREMFKRIRRFIGSPSSRDSPFKRINLFLRWVVRDEYPDLGLWSGFDKRELYMPLGGEIARTAGRVFYGKEIRIARENMYELTERLREINSEDPIKYDFVLSRPQLLGFCLKNKIYSHCSICPLRDVCRVGLEHASYMNPLYSRVKEYVERRINPRTLYEKHALIVRRTIEYLGETGFISDRRCFQDYVIDHEFRPDIYCEDHGIVIGEVKTSSEYVQGPQQLRIYAEEVMDRGKTGFIGVLSYGRIVEGSFEYLRETIDMLNLRRIFDEIYVLDFKGNIRKGEPEIHMLN